MVNFEKGVFVGIATIVLAAIFLLSNLADGPTRAPIPTKLAEALRHEGFVNEGLVGVEPMAVRSYLGGISSGNHKCQLLGRSYSAQFKTPAIVLIPDYGQRSPLPTVTCSSGGETVTVQAKLKNKTKVSSMGTGIEARQNEADDDYGFWPIRVEFKKP